MQYHFLNMRIYVYVISFIIYNIHIFTDKYVVRSPKRSMPHICRRSNFNVIMFIKSCLKLYHYNIVASHMGLCGLQDGRLQEMAVQATESQHWVSRNEVNAVSFIEIPSISIRASVTRVTQLPNHVVLQCFTKFLMTMRNKAPQRFCLGFVVSDVKTKYAGATIVMSFDFEQWNISTIAKPERDAKTMTG